MKQLMEALTRFTIECAEVYYQKKFHEITLERAVDFVEKRNMLPRVFKAKDLEGNLLFVVKFYPAERFSLKMIENLASAEGKLGRLRLKNSQVNLPFAISECIEGQSMYYLIAYPAAEGHSLWLYIEKNDQVILHKALQKVGEALAELHLKALNGSGEISSVYAQQEQHALRFFKKLMESDPKALPLTVDAVSARFDQLRSEMQAAPSPAGWVHGDAMIHHFFYALEKDSLTMIDFDRFIFAILEDEKMGGPIAYDYAFVINSLWQLGVYAGIDDHQIRSLENAFIDTYRMQMGKLFPSDSAIRYYSFIYCLKKACLTVQRLEDVEREAPSFNKLNRMLHYLVKAL